MKKSSYLQVGLAALLLGALLSACSSGGSDSNDPPPATNTDLVWGSGNWGEADFSASTTP